MRTKRTILSVSCLSAVLVFGSVLAVHFARPVHAQSGCDATSISGAYGYTMNGFSYDSQYNVYFLASAGRAVADGNGNLTGTETFNFDGTLAHRTYTGTYTVNSDCTGSATLQVTVGNQTGTVHGDIVAVNNAKQINFVQTDALTIFSGVLTRQTQ